MDRRTFLHQAGVAAGAGLLAGRVTAQSETEADAMPTTYPFTVSLAAWSLHRTIGSGENQRPMLDMPQMAREDFGIGAIELVNRMLASTEPEYLDTFKQNCDDHDIEVLLIMVDGEGSIGTPSERARERTVANHKRWMDIAADFGCHSIRMNWAGARGGTESDPEMLRAFIDSSVPGFKDLCDYGDEINVNVIIENHGGPSSYPDAMEQLMEAVDHERFGTLPDFGNFPEGIDKYDAIDRLMPFAKAVSAKCYDFDDASGWETRIDFARMVEIVCGKHGYDGYIGIEYEGGRLDEMEGIKRAKALLDTMRSA